MTPSHDLVALLEAGYVLYCRFVFSPCRRAAIGTGPGPGGGWWSVWFVMVDGEEELVPHAAARELLGLGVIKPAALSGQVCRYDWLPE